MGLYDVQIFHLKMTPTPNSSPGFIFGEIRCATFQYLIDILNTNFTLESLTFIPDPGNFVLIKKQNIVVRGKLQTIWKFMLLGRQAVGINPCNYESVDMYGEIANGKHYPSQSTNELLSSKRELIMVIYNQIHKSTSWKHLFYCFIK